MVDTLPDTTGGAGRIIESKPTIGVIDVALRDGRSWLAAAPSVAILSGQYLHCLLRNPVDSGRNVIVYNRRFSTSGSDVLQYKAYASPTALPSTDAPPINLSLGHGGVSTTQFSFEANATEAFFGALTGSVETIPANGFTSERRLLALLEPGSSLGFTIAGIGQGNPLNAGAVNVVLEFYEE